MTRLTEILKDRIAVDGPISVADYMAECLMNPKHGYYTQQAVFGRSGDFVTAPEISQMFGEMIGLALGSAWQAQGCPKDAIIVELGPGKGTLMRDLRRISPTISGFEQLRRTGLLTGIFVFGYGLTRFLVELVRQPDTHFQSLENPVGYTVQMGSWGLTMGQVLSLPMLIVGLWFIAKARKA